MNKTSFLKKDDFCDIDAIKLKGKLFIYKEISKEDRKNFFYYNEEEKNELPDLVKKVKSRNKYNNLIRLKTSKTKEIINNNNFSKKTKSLINFVFKDDKNKNLRVNNCDEQKYNNYNSDLYVNLKTYNSNRNSNTNNSNNTNNPTSNIKSYREIAKKKEKNTKSIKNRNLSATFYHKFNVSDLAKIKVDPIKIISQKVFELPKSQICYITKYFKNKKDYLYLKPLKIPKNDICFYKYSYIYKEYKAVLPKNNICYFKKNFIIFRKKPKNINIKKKEFPSDKKDTKKNKEKKSHDKHQKNLKNKIINGVNNDNTKIKKTKIIHRNEVKDLNNETKIKRHKSLFIQSNFINFKILNKENKLNKFENTNKIFTKKIHFNKNKEKDEIKAENPEDKKINKLAFLPNLIENKKEDSNTSSSFDKSHKNSNLFNHLLKNKGEESHICGLKQSMNNKVILHKNISNDNLFEINNNDLLIQKIKNSKNNSTYKAPKTQISPNILSSTQIIKKINFSKNIKRNNNNQLANLPNQASYDINTYNLLNSSRQNQPKNNSMIDINKQNLPIWKIDNNNLRNNYITPYKLKNENINNDEGKIFSGLSRNTKLITLKKINFSSNTNNEKEILAIKQLFNNKN